MQVSAHKIKPSGFTIVELLIVITVIAILASLTLMSFRNISLQAQDTKRKHDLKTLKTAILYHYQTVGEWPKSGINCSTDSHGENFISARGSAASGNEGSKSTADCLIEGGYLQSDMVDPSGTRTCMAAADTLNCRTYMKGHCEISGEDHVFLFANLETLPHTANDTDLCGNVQLWDTKYGMNYVLQVQ